MGEKGSELGCLALAESGSGRRNAEENWFEMEEKNADCTRGEESDGIGLALLTTLTAFSAQRERERWWWG